MASIALFKPLGCAFALLLAVSTLGRAAEIDSMEATAPEKTLKGHTAPVRALTSYDSGQNILSGGDDGLVILWNTAEGKELRRWPAHNGAKITRLLTSTDMKRGASGDDAGVVHVWNLESGDTIYRSPKLSSGVRLLTSDPKGERFLAVLNDESVVLLAPPAEPKVLAAPGAEAQVGRITGLVFEDPGPGVVVARGKKMLEIRTLPDWKNLNRGPFYDPEGPVAGPWIDSKAERMLYLQDGTLSWCKLTKEGLSVSGRVKVQVDELRDVIPNVWFGDATVGLSATHHIVWAPYDSEGGEDTFMSGHVLMKRRHHAKDATAWALLGVARFVVGKPDGTVEIWFTQGRRPNADYWYPAQRLPLNQLLEAEKFDELEAIYKKFADSGERFLEGWRITGGVLDLLAEWPNGAEKRLALLTKWKKRNPRSLLPNLVLAHFYHQWGWSARGNGSAASVDDESAKLFAERMAKSQEVLKDALKCPQESAHTYRMLIAAGKGLGMEPAEMRRLLKAALKVDPQDLQVLEAATLYLLPRWFGEPGDVADMLDEAIEKLPSGDAEEIYFRTVKYAMRFEGQQTQTVHNFNKKRMKAAAQVMLERYPDEEWINQFSLRWAHLVDDLETARKVAPHCGLVPHPSTFRNAVGMWMTIQPWLNRPEADPSEMVKLHDRSAYIGCFADSGKLAVSGNGQSGLAPVLLVTAKTHGAVGGAIPLPQYVSSIAGSPAAQTIAFAMSDHNRPPNYRIGAIDLEAGQVLGVVDEVVSESHVLFSPDGKQLLAYGTNGPWYVYDVADLTAKPREFKLNQEAWMAAFQGDGRHLIVRYQTAGFGVYEFATGKHVRDFGLGDKLSSIGELVISADGKRLLATGHNDASVWNLETYEKIAASKEATGGVLGVAISPDGALVAVAAMATGPEKAARHFVVELRDGKTLAVRRRLKGHWGRIFSLAFSKDGKQLYSLAEDGTMRTWDPQKLLAEPAEAKAEPATAPAASK